MELKSHFICILVHKCKNTYMHTCMHLHIYLCTCIIPLVRANAFHRIGELGAQDLWLPSVSEAEAH